MADQMQRALAIAVVQADENKSLGEALFAAEWVIADLRNDLERTQRTFVETADGYERVIAEIRAELEMSRARLDALRDGYERVVAGMREELETTRAQLDAAR